MKTLIELYDERPLENVLGTEVFRPERTVFICTPEVAASEGLKKQLRAYFRHRGVNVTLEFRAAGMLEAEQVRRCLAEVAEAYPDCALDISGGTDAALFAGGLFCAGNDMPVLTYSRRRNTFYDIRNAAYAQGRPCDVVLKVEDCFLMAGGAMRQGRVDNAILGGYADLYDPFFDVFLRYRREWPRVVTYIQRLSRSDRDGSISEWAGGPWTVKGEHGSRIEAPVDVLYALERAGMISELSLDREEGVSFRFRDAQIRAWLRDVGSVLEVKVWNECRLAGCYDDVVTSAVVDWEPEHRADGVTNEIDVMATRGVKPVFISCKVCDVKTEALNELAILRDRFGGGTARAAIVTAERGRVPMRRRASELGIEVIDLDDLRSGGLRERLAALSH